MKLVCPLFKKVIEFEENQVNVLVIEDKNVYTDMINQLLLQIETNYGDFILSENDEIIDFSKHISIITDYFLMDFNSRKLTIKLYQLLENNVIGAELYKDTLDLKRNISNYMSKTIHSFDYPILYDDDISMIHLFKALNIKFNIQNENFLEKIESYISLCHKFFNTKLFILVGLKSFLSDEDISLLYNQLFYKKINIILLESVEPKNKHKNEKYRILDKDLCEIY